jgi:hypothetical protein
LALKRPVVTSKAWMAKKALKTPDNNSWVQKSTQIKYLTQILIYNDFVLRHYTYMFLKYHINTCFNRHPSLHP